MRGPLSVTLLIACLLPVAVSAAPRDQPTANIAIVSADIRTGQRLAGACNVIVDWSNEGCDENGDGQVDFAGVRPGSYTVAQTRSPAGYSPVADFTITVRNVSNQLFSAYIDPIAVVATSRSFPAMLKPEIG